MGQAPSYLELRAMLATTRKAREARVMEYKGYQAKIMLDEELGLLHGEVANIEDVVTFQGATIEELRLAFAASIEDYVEFCRSRGKQPELPHDNSGFQSRQ